MRLACAHSVLAVHCNYLSKQKTLNCMQNRLLAPLYTELPTNCLGSRRTTIYIVLEATHHVSRLVLISVRSLQEVVSRHLDNSSSSEQASPQHRMAHMHPLLRESMEGR